MQRILRGIEHWCNTRDLRVHPGETELILITRKYKPEAVKPITFYGHQLQLTKQVIIDSKLNWKQHVDAKYQKALMAFLPRDARSASAVWLS